MYEIDQEAFDVGAIVVLICHDHDRPITKILDICVFFTHVETHDFDHVLELIILENHVSGCISHIHEFTFEWENTKTIPTNDL